MFQLKSSRDTVIAEGKTVLRMTLQRLHDYMTNVRMKVLHLVYKHLYTTHIEPLCAEKGVISKRSTTYSEAIDIPFDEFRAKCYDFLQSSDPFESDDAQGLFREIEAQPLVSFMFCPQTAGALGAVMSREDQDKMMRVTTQQVLNMTL